MNYQPHKDSDKEERDKALKLHYRNCFDGKSGEVVLDHLNRIIESTGFDVKDISAEAAIWYAGQRALLKQITNKLKGN